MVLGQAFHFPTTIGATEVIRYFHFFPLRCRKVIVWRLKLSCSPTLFCLHDRPLDGFFDIEHASQQYELYFLYSRQGLFLDATQMLVSSALALFLDVLHSGLCASVFSLHDGLHHRRGILPALALDALRYNGGHFDAIFQGFSMA